MADTPLPRQTLYSNYPYRMRTDWGAIWAGVFTFAAIWSVFGALGLAIFASAANPNTAAPVWNMNVGMSIWTIVLTIIAMYFAGRETGRMAGVATRHDGLVHGMIMFGLSVVSLVVLVSIGSIVLAGTGTTNGLTTHSQYGYSLVSTLGWAGFVALLLGWLAAMGGASTGVGKRSEELRQQTQPPIQMRPAA